MSSRDNFRQAARELFGLESKKVMEGEAPSSIEGFLSELPPDEPDGGAAPQPTAAQGETAAETPPSVAESVAHGTGYAAQRPAPDYQPQPQPEQQPAYTPPQQTYAAQGYAPQQSSTPVYQPAPPAVQPAQEYSIVDTRRETSIIAKGTTIVGRVRTDGHIEVMGRVEGNIDAEGNVAVSGRVAGNVKGSHLELLSCQVKGNLNAAAGVFVNSDTVIVGDISAENVIFDGRIKGNVEASQSAEFNRNSYIVGDISAKTISIEPGAVINGMIRTLSDQFDDGDFDELGKF